MSKLPEDWPLRPGDDLDAAIAWCAEQGLDAKRILRDTFEVTPGLAEGEWWATGHYFALDENGRRIVIEGGPDGPTYQKTPFTVQVSSRPPFLEESA